MLQTAQKRAQTRILSTPLIINSSRISRRCLATPSNSSNSPATMVQRQRLSNTDSDAERNQMRDFLRSRKPVLLPSPLPPKSTLPSTSNHLVYYPSTSTLDQLSIMEACLTNYLDMPRAYKLFEAARADEKLKVVLDERVYNAFLERYFGYAELEAKEGRNGEYWKERGWSLYDFMESEKEGVRPNAGTYAIVLRALSRSQDLPSQETLNQVAKILQTLDLRGISLPSVLDHPILTCSSSAEEDRISIIQLVARASKSLPRDIAMAKLESIGVTPVQSQQGEDILDSVDEVLTQQKRKRVTKEVEGERVTEEVFETPYNLAILRENLNSIIQSRRNLPDDVLTRQKLLEETAYDSALSKLKHDREVFEEIGMGGNLSSRGLKEWMWDWHQATVPHLTESIKKLCEEEIAAENKKRRGNPAKILPIGGFLKLLPPEKMALIAILEVLGLLASAGYQDGARTTRVVLTVGSAIEAEHHFQAAKGRAIPIPEFKSRSELGGSYSIKGYMELHKERVKAKLELEGGENWMPGWTQEVRARVGAVVLDALMEKAEVVVGRELDDKRYEESQAAFYNTYRYERGFKIGVIKVNDVIIEKMSREPVKSQLQPRHLPMVVKPRPWIRHNAGGYLYSNSSVMRMKESSEQNSYLKEADSRGAVELVYAGLDVLGKTAWKVNKGVFDVALEVWNKGLEYPRIPPRDLVQKFPDPPTDPSDMKAKADYAVAMRKLAQERGAHHSDRCSTNYKMEIARTFLGEKFYLPHNVDFRGRAYPIPPHLNQMGDDLSRGLIMFADGKQLGKKGLRWLKIHLSNLCGYDKASLDDREAFATEHLEEVYDSAENPTTGRQWWLKADDPWQCLATCMELRNALESPDPEAYISYLPVHQDGTCNGLQHYAALGGDTIGAKQVNLDVSDRPSDVYTYVSEMAKVQIQKDAEAGNEHAKWLLGKVNRKVVKQTVMTTVYGVTFIGARDQIHRQLKNAEDYGALDIYPWANYLAKVTLSCIGTLFKGAKSIQSWLNDCARLISKSIPEDRIRLMLLAERDHKIRPPQDLNVPQKKQWEADKKAGKEQMTTVVWTTLLGLPIVQPYRKAGRKQIMTQLQTVYISDPNQPQAVNTTKQVSAFPPNFVHSLDATHMMLTALQCDRQGLTFAAVHDSYWTHAASVDEMSIAIRDSFVHLHSSNVLENLLKEFQERYKNYKVPIEVFKKRANLAAISKSPKYAEVKEMVGDQLEEEAAEKEEEDAEEASAEIEENEQKPKKRDRKSTKLEKAEKMLFFDAEKKRTAKELKEVESVMKERYVNLVDVLPPLPEKGEFDIEVIKNSPYFFS